MSALPTSGIAIKPTLRTLLIAVLALSVTSAGAESIYKLVDKNGKVVYTSNPPLDFDGTVKRLDIDASASTVPLATPAPRAGSGRAETEAEKIIRRPTPLSSDDRLQAARQKVDAAQKALDDALNNSMAEDWMYGANAQRSWRVRRPEYRERLEQLEQALNMAQEELRSVERSR